MCLFHGAEELDLSEFDPEEIIEMIYDSGQGYHAPVWLATGDSAMALMVEAVKFAATVPDDIEGLLDEPKNQVGWSGWYFVTGFENSCWRDAA